MYIVGFIGLGRMGLPMAANIQNAGYRIAAYDARTEERDGAQVRLPEELE